ncbi:hypothetical protein D8674_020695 [Pyrus ussuriensis x Pyrus communis]|uniref:Uncharacterized protein n=1 Tax=Pyrus ussuriensis x Pyrus communis TaxID=2448454 RepID=A0A5N5HJT6_9ROSA|nr:hypothetical protein D8674_020694 [Pyrus ussuriensis x Pyrus communis]KAB2627077.1 hypothetical protein D8674_020695 [Pyrus ussuriensis x Pyrus communis]
MYAEESSVNANINPVGGDKPPTEASVIPRADNPLPNASTPGASNEPQEMTTAPENSKDPVNRHMPFMDQI